MTITEEGRSRPRLVKLAAGVVLAGVACGVIGTGVAQAQVPPVDPPLNLSAEEVAGPAINVDWDAPTSGGAVTYYELEFEVGGTVVFETFLPASMTEFSGFAAAPGTTYDITVISNNEVSFAGSTITFTTATGPIGCSLAEWAPFCTVDAFIRQQYADWVERTPTLDELNFWRAYLQPRDEADGGTQNVFLDMLRQEKDLVAGPVVRLYIAYFLRNPEYGGYTFWLDAVQSGAWSMGQVSEFFSQSPEFQATYGSLDDAEFVSLVYQNVLGRNPDAAGFAFWTRQLQSGFSRGWMMMQFTEAPSFEFQNLTVIAVATTEIVAEMLERVPTLAEYNFATFALAGMTYPIEPAEANPIYIVVLNSAEYAARINPR